MKLLLVVTPLALLTAFSALAQTAPDPEVPAPSAPSDAMPRGEARPVPPQFGYHGMPQGYAMVPGYVMVPGFVPMAMPDMMQVPGCMPGMMPTMMPSHGAVPDGMKGQNGGRGGRGGMHRRGGDHARSGHHGGRGMQPGLFSEIMEDGEITRDEFDATAAKMFERFDADGDGVITESELPRHRGKKGRYAPQAEPEQTPPAESDG